MIPLVTATAARRSLRPVAKALGCGSGVMKRRGMGMFAARRKLADDRIELRGLAFGDRFGPRCRDCDSVREPVRATDEQQPDSKSDNGSGTTAEKLTDRGSTGRLGRQGVRRSLWCFSTYIHYGGRMSGKWNVHVKAIDLPLAERFVIARESWFSASNVFVAVEYEGEIGVRRGQSRVALG